MSRASRPSAPRKPQASSRVTNGSDLLPGIDGRSSTARRYRDVFYALVADQGGPDHLSEARSQLCRRFAALSALAEAQEARLARGEPLDLTEYAQLASTMVRVASRIGLARRARDITPRLADYIDGTMEPAE